MALNVNTLFDPWFYDDTLDSSFVGTAEEKQYSRATVLSLDASTIYSELMFSMMEDIDNTGYFRQVFCYPSEPKSINVPAIAIYQAGFEDVTDGISNVSKWVDYKFTIGVALKCSDDVKLLKMLAKATDVIRKLFPEDKRYTNVTGHFRTFTKAEGSAGYIDGPNGVLIYDAGLTITCRVQEDI